MSQRKKTILVTGSAGFIGFHVSRRLLQLGYHVIGFDNFNNYYSVKLKEDRNKILELNRNFKLYRGNLGEQKILKKVFQENKIAKVCHLAAQAGVRYSLKNPDAYVQSNLVGFVNLLEAMRQYKVKDLIYASSSSVYGNNKKIPFSESDNVDQAISLYAATKKSNEVIAYVYHHLYGINCTGLRFFTVYGPWGRPDMALFKFTKAILANKPIEVYNYGKMQRDFTYIDDVVRGVIKAINKCFSFEIINLGNNKPVKLKDFIAIIETELKQKAAKKYLPLQPGDMIKTYADIRKAKKLLNFQPKTSIEVGLKKFIKWYKDYYRIQESKN